MGGENKVRLKPLSKRVLLKKLKPEKEKVVGGIVIPVDEDNTIGAEVVAIAEDIERPGFKVGDVVIYDEIHSKDIKIDNEEYVLVKDEHIFGVINN